MQADRRKPRNVSTRTPSIFASPQSTLQSCITAQPSHRPTAVIFCEGNFGLTDGKTANGLIRYSPAFEIQSVIDSSQSGLDSGCVLENTPNGIPIVGCLNDAIDDLTTVPAYFIYGIAPASGTYSDAHRQVLLAAMRLGMNIVNGLHEFLNDDHEFQVAAQQYNVRIFDLRRPRAKKDLQSFSSAIHQVDCPRIAIMGTDCAIGKRTTATILANSLRAQGVKVILIATGQTGVMQGNPFSLVMDAIPAQFCAGELEAVICKAYHAEQPDVILIEGQGALGHPAYSTSSFILRGSAPQAVILQHAPKRKTRADFDHMPMPTAASEINLIEAFCNTRVIGITINHEHMSEQDIAQAMRDEHQQTGLPVTDALLHAPNQLVDMVLDAFPNIQTRSQVVGL